METSPTSDFLPDDLGQFDFSTEFFDFDMGQTISSLPGNDLSSLETDTAQSHGLPSGDPHGQSNPDFVNGKPNPPHHRKIRYLTPNLPADFTFTDFTFPADFTNTTPTRTIAPVPLPQPNTTKTHKSTVFPPTTPTQSRPSTRNPSTVSIKTAEPKSAPSQSSDPQSLAAEAARLAAEEDKRRRNTAASARFRVKKKQREQALEKTSREMTERAAVLEQRVQALEMENRWLKGLITGREDERDEGQVEEIGVRASKEELEGMFRRFVERLKVEGAEEEGERPGKRVKIG
jgi:hypothetical protein